MKAIAITLAVLMIAGVLYAGNGDLVVDGNFNVDQTNANDGSVTPGMQFGSGSGEGIASKRTSGGNQWGLDFYTGYSTKMSISSPGNVGIGTTGPGTKLDIRATANVADGINLQGSDNHWTRIIPSMPGGWCNPLAQNGDIGIIFSNSFSTPGGGAFVVAPWSASGSPGMRIGGNGNIGIGTAALGSGGSSALLLGNGSKPSNISNEAGLYTSNSQLRAFDSYGNDNLISPHAPDAPDSLYDIQDGMPMIVKEIQYFLGYVRYTNQTRQARLAGMTDAEKQQIAPAGRTCVIQETFAEHEARTGEKLTQLVWEEEQAKIKEVEDARRQAMIDARAQLSTQVAAKDNAVAAAKGDSRGALQQESTDLKSKLDAIQIPDEYVIQPIPPRLQAALNAAGI